MDYSFLAIAKGGKTYFKDPDLHNRALLEKEGEEIIVSYKSVNRLSKKQKLFNYLHAVVYEVAMDELTNLGWESMSKEKVDHFFKSRFAKTIIYNSKTEQQEESMRDKSKMNIDELYEYVNKCILFVEMELGREVPDSSEHKQRKLQK